jgi:hypothetical protein
MNYRTYFSLIALLAHCPIFAQQASSNRPLIIIFDSKNSDTHGHSVCSKGAMKLDMRAALTQQAAPIIASRWLLDYINSCQQENSDLLAQWDIYTSDPSIVHPDKSTHDPILVCTPKQQGFSSGFNMEKLIKVDPSAATPLKSSNPSDDLRAYLNAILITNANKNADQQSILWDIYITGHGSPTSTIAGMSIASFKSFLDFLNFGITTRSLTYNSCYSGGANLKSPYTYTTDIPQDTDFNFMIINANTISSRTYTPSSYDFKKYFNGINDYYNGNKDISLPEIIINVVDWKDTFRFTNILMVPTVRYPHTGWFTVDQIDKRLFRLNDRVIKGKKEINIPADAQVVLLQTTYIPIPIIISSREIPLLTPQDSSTHYFFKEIIAPSASLLNPTSWLDFLKTDFVKFVQASMGIGSVKTSEDFLTMYLKLKVTKFSHFFFIEKLTTQLKNQRTKTGSLGWADGPLVFENVILRSAPLPAIPQIGLVHNDTPAYFVTQDGSWTLGASSAMPNFQKMKESILSKSTLAASLKNEAPMQEPLYYGYLKRQSNPTELEAWKKTLTKEQLERLERLVQEIIPPLE